jgi:hypothetical protein
MKLTTKIAFLMFVIFSIMVSITFTKKSHKSHSRKSKLILTPMSAYQTDKSSIWTAASTVDLLIELSRDNTVPEIIASKVTLKQYQDVQKECLGNLKNLGGKWGNNMRYFWNIVTDYYKTKDTKWMVSKTFQEAFQMCNGEAATGHYAGKKCEAVFVMKFDETKATKVIMNFLKKFNLVPPKTPLITSFIGTHRNIAPAGFFKKLNRDRRRR